MRLEEFDELPTTVGSAESLAILKRVIGADWKTYSDQALITRFLNAHALGLNPFGDRSYSGVPLHILQARSKDTELKAAVWLNGALVRVRFISGRMVVYTLFVEGETAEKWAYPLEVKRADEVFEMLRNDDDIQGNEPADHPRGQ